MQGMDLSPVRLFHEARLVGKAVMAVLFAATLLAHPALAKDTLFWNLTASTVKSFQLAAAGTTAFGPNQCLNDADGAVDHDERLDIKGVRTGAYDAKLTLADGRKCMAKNAQVVTGKVFSLEEKDLTGCTKLSSDSAA